MIAALILSILLVLASVIVVGDTDASLKLYRDTLGMHIACKSENYGTEQEHLNNVSGRGCASPAFMPPEAPA